MQISVRARLSEGAAAVVGAAAVLAQSVRKQLPVPARKASVALAGFSNPFAELLGTLEMGQNYFFGVYYTSGDQTTPGAGEANWPYAGLDQTGGDYLNYALCNNVELGHYSFVGEVPQNITDLSPVIRQLQSNVSEYINAGITGFIVTGLALSDGGWDFPAALATAAEQALSGHFSDAPATLTTAVISPIQLAAASLIETGSHFVTSAAARLGAVVAAQPQIAIMFADAAARGTALSAEKVSTVSTAVLTGVFSLNFERAWNAAVAGWLGPSGIPGLSLNLFSGAGIQTGPIKSAADIPTNFVPSMRTATQAAVWILANALRATASPAAVVPAGPAPVRTPRSATSARAPRAVRAVKTLK